MVWKGVLQTSVDQLLVIVKDAGKISVEEAAKKLNMSPKILQNIVDSLVEEKILGIEYKFTTPYIYLYKGIPSSEELRAIKTEEVDIESTKKEFYDKCKLKGCPADKTKMLWKNYVDMNLGFLKDKFIRLAAEKGLAEYQIEMLWERYLEKILL